VKAFRAITQSYILLFLCSLFINTGCMIENGKISVKFIPANITRVAVINNQLIITGSNLNSITNVQVQGDSLNESLTIETKNNTQIIANGNRSINFSVNTLLNLILSNAEASASFPVTFTMSNNSITAAMLTSMGATTGQVMQYNGTTWVPGNLSASQTYMGSWNASTNTPDLSIGGYSSGEYYIVSAAGTYGGITYAVGDWAIYNGTSFDKVDNSATTITKTTVQPVSKLRVYGSNSTNYVEISSPTLSGNLNFIFPSTSGSNGNFLKTDGAGNLSWAAAPTAPVSSVNSQTGTVVLSTTDIAEGTNLYYTDARVRAATLTGYSVGTNTAISATDTTLGALQKLQGQINSKASSSTLASDVLATVLTGFSSATATVITATDTILSALGKTQGQLGNKADVTNVTQTITAAAVTGLTTPLAGSDAVNKTYVDGFGQWTKTGSDIYRPSGKVGVGMTPTNALDVSGTVGATTFSGSGSGLTNISGANMTAAASRRTCMILIGADNGSTLVDADIAPQAQQCYIPAGASIVEIMIRADAGTPSVVLQRRRGGTTADLLSGSLTTAASGGASCATSTASQTCIDGTTTSSASVTLSNATLAAGDWIETKTASASTAKRFSIAVVYTIN
jgi:hypothetical protein